MSKKRFSHTERVQVKELVKMQEYLAEKGVSPENSIREASKKRQQTPALEPPGWEN